MSVPQEYTEARKKLTDFRDLVFSDLVNTRIKAGLNASHDSMKEYSAILYNMSIVPYLFGEVNRKAVALKIGKMDVGNGKETGVRADFSLEQVDYPLQPPFNVKRRKLPQVDVFVYEPITDVEYIEKVGIQGMKSFFLLQVDHGMFGEVPSVENANYEYYELVPQVKVRAKWSIINQETGYSNSKWIKGEMVFFEKLLTIKGTYNLADYGCYVWLDAQTFSDTEFVRNIQICVCPKLPQMYPSVILSCAGQRIKSPDEASLYITGLDYKTAMNYLDLVPPSYGFGRMGDLGNVSGSVTTWENNFAFNIDVNSLAMGYTVPSVGKYRQKAGYNISITAYANSGYKFDHWERNGVPVGNWNPFTDLLRDDYTYKAVFLPA